MRYIIIDTQRSTNPIHKENLMAMIKLHPNLRSFVIPEEESLAKFKEVFEAGQDQATEIYVQEEFGTGYNVHLAKCPDWEKFKESL